MEKVEVLDVDETIEKFENRNSLEITKLGEDPAWLKEMKAKEQNSPANIMRIALTHGQDLEKIEKMLELQIKWEENEAKKAYHKAMATFKADPPKVWRDLQVKYTANNKVTEWSHADLGVAGEAIGKGLGDNQLNHTWRTEQLEDNQIKVTCIITHELGHSESTWLKSPPDSSGGKNSIQAIGSTTFYLERYTLFAIAGLAPARMDDDGKGSDVEVEYVSKGQVVAMQKIIDEKGLDTDLFFTYVSESIVNSEVKKLEEIPKKDFKEVMIVLKKAKKVEREPGQEG